MIYLLSLNWNTSGLMKQMYASAIKYKETPNKDFTMVIVDNGSNNNDAIKLLDGTLLEDDTNLVIRPLKENIGFAAGNNVGLRIIEESYPSDDDIVIFINSDIEITEQGWDTKFKELLSDRYVGVVGAAYHPLRWTKDGHFKILPIPNKPVDSEGVQGAFFGMRWDVLKKAKEASFTGINCGKLSWFDEEFKFAHYEESDLIFRAMKLGYRCLWMPCGHIHHHNNSATKINGYKLSKDIKNIDDFKANSERNRQRLIEKHKDRFNATNSR